MQESLDGPVRAIIPMKDIRNSKTRLTSLDAKQRAQLSIAMLSNVLVALGESRGIGDVTVVSSDRGVAKIAHGHGAKFLWEGKRPELNKALRLAIRRVARRGTDAVMIVHADLPFLTARNIDRLLTKSRDFEVAIVPCKNGTGTNALLMRRSNAISPSFGKASFKTHLSQAKERKLRWTVQRIPEIQFDIDSPGDLSKFLQCPRSSKVFRHSPIESAPKSSANRSVLRDK